ncbi:MAG TPA: PQQ-binding-like beta-propeller repeat protein [Acidimicrobiales bacterium]
MQSLRQAVRFAGLIVFLIALACSSDDSDSGGSTAGDRPEDGSSAAADWTMLGWDLGNTRAAVAETAVGVDNVATLQPVWNLDVPDGVTATPVVADGVVYVGDWTGHVHALDAVTGESVWEADVTDSNIYGAVALDDSRVFVGTADKRVVALDRSTGDQAWEAEVEEHPAGTIFGSPVVADGTVLVGLASFEEMVTPSADQPTFKGSVMALDAETGDERWHHFLTKGDETEGPGVPVWSSPTVDTDRREVYIGTGNTYAPPSSSRGDGIVTLDLDTGDEKWAYQFTIGETWRLNDPVGTDSDVGAPPNLFDAGGTPAVGAGDKGGSYQALDRATGELLWSAKLTEGSVLGAVMAGAAVAQDTVFVASNRGAAKADLIALGTTDGAEKWRTDVEGRVTGPVSWANGVVYVADDDSHISGFDASTGERLWRYDTAEAAAGGIAIVDGTVYAAWGWALPPVSPPWKGSPQGGIIAFRAGGEPAPPSSDDESADNGDAAPDGAEIYRQSCAACHGPEGQGGRGPSLEGIDQRMSLDEHLAVVQKGRGNMPAWEDSLTPEEIDAVVEYERTVLANSG